LVTQWLELEALAHQLPLTLYLTLLGRNPHMITHLYDKILPRLLILFPIACMMPIAGKLSLPALPSRCKHKSFDPGHGSLALLIHWLETPTTRPLHLQCRRQPSATVV